MPERFLKLTLDEWFFPAIFGEDSPLQVYIASPDTLNRYLSVRREILDLHPTPFNLSLEVHLFPGVNKGRKGHFVRVVERKGRPDWIDHLY